MSDDWELCPAGHVTTNGQWNTEGWLACVLPAGHEGLHYDEQSGVDWEEHDGVRQSR